MSKDSNPDQDQGLMSAQFPAINSQIAQAVEYTNKQVSSYKDEEVSLIADSLTSEAKGLAADAARSYMNAVMQISLAAQTVWTKELMKGLDDNLVDPTLTSLQETQTMLNNMVTNAVGVFSSVVAIK